MPTRFHRLDRRLVLTASMLATFAVTRISLHLDPDADVYVAGYNIHHLFTGAVILTFCGIPAVVRGGADRLGLVFVAGFGSGLSLVLDEWLYLIVTDGSNAAYVQWPSLAGGASLVALACIYVWVLPRWRDETISDFRRR